MSEVDDDKTENDDGNIEIDQSVEESNDSNSMMFDYKVLPLCL
jgi:hypothetical protein